MEYKNLRQLDNQYPGSSINYLPSIKENVVSFYGIYSDVNKIDFTLHSLDDLKFVNNTNFRFILCIFKDTNDTNPVFYTSKKYYDDLIKSHKEYNPYFIQASFNPQYIVSFYYSQYLDMVKGLRNVETGSFVDMRINNFVNSDLSIDYEGLVMYIDWVVDTVNPLDTDNGGVLNPELIAGWDIKNGEALTGVAATTISASFGIGKKQIATIAGSDTNSLNDVQNKLAANTLQVTSLDEKIKMLQTEVDNDIPNLNYKTVVVGEFTFVSKVQVGDFFGTISGTNKNIVKSDLRNQINAKIKELQSQKEVVTKDSMDLTAQIENIKNTIAGAQNLIGQAKQIAGAISNLREAFPKFIPNLSIPKIPGIADVKDLATSMLPKVPELPSVPSIPKFSLSSLLPPLPKLNFKKPKIPKKFKKGLAGLKETAGNLQNAAGDIQKQATDAAASVQGAVDKAKSNITDVVSKAQQIANDVKSKVENAQNVINQAQQAANDIKSGNLTSAVSKATSVMAGAQQTILDAKQILNKSVASAQSNLIDSQQTSLSKSQTKALAKADIEKQRLTAITQENGTYRKLVTTSNGGINNVRKVYNDPTGLSPTGLIYADLTEVKPGDLLNETTG